MFEIFAFAVIALMRVVQTVYKKKTSNLIEGKASFFHYGAFYQIAAAGVSLIALPFVGFYGFNAGTVLCAAASALLFAVDLFTGLEAVKGCSLIVGTVFSLGGLLISCVLGVFLFDEPMSIFQLLGLAVFFLAAYLLTPPKKEPKRKICKRTWGMLFINMIANGLVMVVQKYFSLRAAGGNVALFSFLTFAFNGAFLSVCFALLRLRQNKTGEKVVNRLSKPLLIGGTLMALSLFAINLLVTELGKSVPSVILFPTSSAIGIVMATLAGRVFFKERLSGKNVIGLALGLLSIVVIGVLTPEAASRICRMYCNSFTR